MGKEAQVWYDLPIEEKRKYAILESNYCIFILRPNIGELLDYAFKHYNVYLWTWGSKVYADDFAKLLLRNSVHRFEHIWSKNTAYLAQSTHGFSKALKYLWTIWDHLDLTPSNTILVDNLLLNVDNPINNRNAIHVQNFEPFKDGVYTDLSHDKTFLNLIDVLKKVCTNKHYPFYSFVTVPQERQLKQSKQSRQSRQSKRNQ